MSEQTKPYTPTPFQVTVTIEPVDPEYCDRLYGYCRSFKLLNDQRCNYCVVFCKWLDDSRRLPECLEAERKAKEVQP